MKPKSLFKFLPMVLICTLAFAEENSKAKQSFYAYLHPASPYGLLLFLADNGFFYFTAEYKLNDFYSIVMAPSIWSGKEKGYHESREDYFRLGTAIGLRRFVSKNKYGIVEGFYLQLMPGAYYLSCEDYYKKETISKTMIDILGYIGYGKEFFGFNTFVEGGVGFRWSSLDNSFGDIPFPLSQGYKNLAININIGIGLPLF